MRKVNRPKLFVSGKNSTSLEVFLNLSQFRRARLGLHFCLLFCGCFDFSGCIPGILSALRMSPGRLRPKAVFASSVMNYFGDHAKNGLHH